MSILLISFFVRRSFTDDPPANRLDSIFIGYIDEIEEHHYVGNSWSIEHIMPQTLSTEWKKMLAGADSEAVEKIRTDNVNKLGNLTLTPYNSELSNRPFKDKKAAYSKSPLNSGLNSYICQQENGEWGGKTNSNTN